MRAGAAIGPSVRIACGALGLLFLMLAAFLVFDAGILPSVPLFLLGAAFVLPAFHAGEAPSGTGRELKAKARWSRRASEWCQGVSVAGFAGLYAWQRWTGESVGASGVGFAISIILVSLFVGGFFLMFMGVYYDESSKQQLGDG